MIEWRKTSEEKVIGGCRSGGIDVSVSDWVWNPADRRRI